MPFAVQLYFDAGSDIAIRSVWEALGSAGVPFPLRDPGSRPHISLALYEQIDVSVCTRHLTLLAQTLSPFPLSIASLGMFSSDHIIVFLAPVVNSDLLHLHSTIHQLLQDATALSEVHYQPGHWTPHCTLATHLPPHFLTQVVQIGLEIAFPLPVSIAEIGIIEYPPVTRLFSCPLTGI